MHRILFTLLLAAHVTAQQATAATSPLTLDEALRLVAAHHPALAAGRLELDAADGATRQAGLIPNPSLAFEAENFGGSGDLRGADAVEFTAQFEQPIELGGKRAKRVRTAELSRRLAGFDRAAGRLDVEAETRRRFVAAQSAQERAALSDEFTALAEDFLRATQARVRAGKVSPLEETKAAIVLANQKIERDQARRENAAALMNLSALWGEGAPPFTSVAGRLQDLPELPALPSLQAALARNPDVARWADEVGQRRAALASAKADRIPDLSAAGGLRQFRASDDHAFVAGLSMPLPLFHRNQGALQEGAARVAQAEQEQRAAEWTARAELAAAHQVLATALATATSLAREVVPGAQEVLAATRTGYTQGKYTYLEVLEAQRALFEAKAGQLEVLTECHLAGVEVQRLTSAPNDDQPKMETK